MLPTAYQKILQSELSRVHYLFVVLLVGVLQQLKDLKLESLAEALPLPILFESRRKKLRRFLKLDFLSIEKLWLPCLKALILDVLPPHQPIYLAIDRTNWSSINLLMVSVIYDHRALPVYWKFLNKQGSTNLAEQIEVLEVSLACFSEYNLVVLGDREFCSPKLGNYLRERGVYFCLRLKCDMNIQTEQGYQALRDFDLSPGMKLFLNDRRVTKKKQFFSFNIACKWKRSYRGFKTKEPWYILTNLEDLERGIKAYQKRFGIEEMFRDYKRGGYNLEGSKLDCEALKKLLIIVAIAYTSASVHGKKIKQMGLQKYVVRPESEKAQTRRHSSFYVGQHLNCHLQVHSLCQDIIAELLQINRRWLRYYKKGQRAIELALSIF